MFCFLRRLIPCCPKRSNRIHPSPSPISPAATIPEQSVQAQDLAAPEAPPSSPSTASPSSANTSDDPKGPEFPGPVILPTEEDLRRERSLCTIRTTWAVRPAPSYRTVDNREVLHLKRSPKAPQKVLPAPSYQTVDNREVLHLKRSPKAPPKQQGQQKQGKK